MNRDISKLTEKVYDLVIIGGGIYGAAAAWDAASRGLSVALLEQEDFGSKNSSNSQKTIHGGLRYIQHGDIKRMRESICERTSLMRIAPHLVHPMPCLIPTYGRLMQSVMPLALNIYDIVSFDRNKLEDPQKHIPSGRVVSREECMRMIPGINDDGLTGGVIWHDSQVYNTERMVLSFVKSAEIAGADAANYVKVIGFLREGNCIKGIKGNDVLNDSEIEVKAKIVLNASGPWVDSILGLVKESHSHVTRLTKMMLLVVNRRFAHEYAFGVPSRKKSEDKDAVVNKGYRLLFISPWRDYSLIGTAQELYEGDPDKHNITENDIQGFIEEINEAYPHAALSRKDVSFFYGGLLPIDGVNQNGDVNLVKRYRIYDHEKEGIKGLVSIIGVKYTEGRFVAQKTVDMIYKKLGLNSPECITMETQVQGGQIGRFNGFLEEAIEKRPEELSEETVKQLVCNYGSEYPEIVKFIDEDPDYAQRISARSHVIKAEILFNIREEMAQKLADVVLRRTELGSAGYPGDDALKTCADIMAQELGWDEAKVQREIEDVKMIYVLD
ncbi:MAG: glycerol-3-phosphate dehydrogenase/oxidase [Candidatus Methanoperedens sp.]|nr:glycerol-3-phosphate dehydrogenase/oxidase [Candidatus Methanoperedens sp.]